MGGENEHAATLNAPRLYVLSEPTAIASQALCLGEGVDGAGIAPFIRLHGCLALATLCLFVSMASPPARVPAWVKLLCQNAKKKLAKCLKEWEDHWEGFPVNDCCVECTSVTPASA